MCCEAPEVLIEGPAGTGKTLAALYKVYSFCKNYPGCRALICRQTRASLTESVLVTLERDILWPGHPCFSGDANRAGRHSYDWPNRSTIVCGGLDNADRLFSTEWDIVYLAEATESTEDTWEKFARAMRSGKGPYHQRIADCNPGAPGHWLNQRAGSGRMVRLKSRHEDNPSVTQEYLTALRGLTGHRRARLYEGIWSAAEGSVYPEFSEQQHVIAPFAIPWEWPCYLAKDPGRDHPDATLVATVTPLGQLIIVAESITGNTSDAGRSSTTEEDARTIDRLFSPNFRIVRKLGDPHMMFSETKFAQNGETIAKQMANYGHHFEPAPAARNQAEIAAQCDMVRTRLTTISSDGAPMLQVFRTCKATIRGFQTWSYDRDSRGQIKGGEDRFSDVGDDEMDCVRMLVASQPEYEPSTSPVVFTHQGRR